MISVVIPTYNRAQTIRMAVDSVLNQTYRDIELIIVDDASTDGTQDVVTQIADDRIRYLRLAPVLHSCTAVRQRKVPYRHRFPQSRGQWI